MELKGHRERKGWGNVWWKDWMMWWWNDFQRMIEIKKNTEEVTGLSIEIVILRMILEIDIEGNFWRRL